MEEKPRGSGIEVLKWGNKIEDKKNAGQGLSIKNAAEGLRIKNAGKRLRIKMRERGGG